MAWPVQSRQCSHFPLLRFSNRLITFSISQREMRKLVSSNVSGPGQRQAFHTFRTTLQKSSASGICTDLWPRHFVTACHVSTSFA